MSVIAAKVYSDRIVVSSDSILTKDDMKRTDYTKLIKTSDMIVGGCGGAEELCLFLTYAKSHTVGSSKEIDVIKFMRSFSDFKEDMTRNADIENEYIIVYKNKLFLVDGFFVKEVKDYIAIGAGDCYAQAALYLGHDTHVAVKAACDLCCYASEPIITYSTYVGHEYD